MLLVSMCCGRMLIILISNFATVVQNGGKIGSRKGVNLPGKEVDLPAISEKDKVSRCFFEDKNYACDIHIHVRVGCTVLASQVYSEKHYVLTIDLRG